MAAPNLSNRRLAENLRHKLLKKCNEIMEGKDETLKKELLLKMVNTLLPRLNEHTGEGGQPIILKFEERLADIQT